MEDNCLLKLENITKTFPGVQALKGVNLTVNKGEVHALIGENGAGKSTLMKCLIGMQPPTTGEIWYDGKIIKDYDTRAALNMGISMIHQELSPIEHRTISENIWLGREPKNKFGFISYKQMNEQTREVLKLVDLQEEPTQLMKNLTVAKVQMIEIAKAISYNAKVIIMDEPTSGLDPKTNYSFKELIRQLNSEDRTILISSHMLSELSEVCTDIGVIDHGHMVIESSLSDILNKFNNTNPIKIRIMGNEDKAFKIFKEDVNVRHVSAREGIFFIKFTGTKRDEAALLKKLVAEDIPVSEFMREEAKLETFFMDITASNKERIIIENDY